VQLTEWQQAGVWARLHALLLAELRAADEIDWSRAVIDASYIQAKKGLRDGPSPVDRGRCGSKYHLLTDGSGIPLAWTVTGANRNEDTQLLLLLEAVPPVRGRPGWPKRRPQQLIADRGYDHDLYRRQLRALGVEPLIARRKTEHGSGLGSPRWVVERTFAWLHEFHRPHVRYERTARTLEALLNHACCLICFRRLESSLS
jgi:transposase